uniref:Uncharacterized protein n=1 Tax=Salarias fasciatus TaxID=181472 RepID=A0A672H2X9_SALFA
LAEGAQRVEDALAQRISPGPVFSRRGFSVWTSQRKQCVVMKETQTHTHTH